MRRALLALAVARRRCCSPWRAVRRCAQDDDSALGIRQVDSTDPAAVEVTFFYTGERDALGRPHRAGGRRQVVDDTSAVPLDDQQSLGVVLVIDSSKSMEAERPDRAGPRGGARLRRRQGADRPDRHRQLRRRRHPRRGLHHRRGRAQRGDRLDRPRGEHLAVGRHRAVRPPLRRLHAAAEPDRVLRRRRQRLHRHRRAGAGRGHRRRRHALRGRRGELRASTSSPTVAEATGGAAAVADDPEGVGALFEEVQQTLRKQYVTTFVSEATDVGRHPDHADGRQRHRHRGVHLREQPAGRRVARSRSPSRSHRARLPPVAGWARHRPRPRRPRRRGDRLQRRQLVLRQRRRPPAGAAALLRGLRRRRRHRRRRRRRRQGPAARPDAAPAARRGGHRDLRREARASSPRSRRCSSGPTSRCARPRRSSSTPPASPSSRCCSFAIADSPIAALIGIVIVALIPPAIVSYLGQPAPQAVRVAAPRHPPAPGQHPAGRLLAHAGRRGGVAGGVRADGPGAAPGRHRGPPRPPARGGARRRRRAAWSPATSPGP